MIHSTRALFTVTMMLATSALSACASLPSSGPTAHQVVNEEKLAINKLGFKIIPLTPDVMPTVTQPASLDTSALRALEHSGRVDLVGPGDILAISIYEVGTTLFGSGTTTLGGAGNVPSVSSFDPSARVQALPGVVINEAGQIRLPFVGVLNVAGKTTGQIARMIEHGLAGKSQLPQVLVEIRTNVTNTVLVSGVVARPGRQQLSLERERLLDAIAAAGGTGTQDGPQSTLVRVTRDGRTAEVYLEAIESGSPGDIILLPGDRIDLLRRPRTYSVFGAVDRVQQFAFDSRYVTLDEAIARSGGLADARADSSAVFVFRNDTAPGSTPVIYRLDMSKPSSFFLAQRFQMRDKDLIYVANARFTQTRKLVEIMNLLFSPIYTARVIAQ
jgi:polysaccharide export outer membrane protein